VHRYSHEENLPPDVCVSVVFSHNFFVGADGDDDRLRTHGVPAVLAPTNRLAFLKLRLLKLTEIADSFALEGLACEMIDALRCGGIESRLYRERQIKWYAERVEAVREVLETRYWEPHSLASLAESVGMSPFQFARVFRELTGEPPHHYLLRVRLERASRMLLDGKPVTETCFEVGFSNLSHFTRSFRRRFGHAPSSLKAARSAPSRRLAPAHTHLQT
jgi:AraC-like DNA-binding protein